MNNSIFDFLQSADPKQIFHQFIDSMFEEEVKPPKEDVMKMNAEDFHARGIDKLYLDIKQEIYKNCDMGYLTYNIHNRSENIVNGVMKKLHENDGINAIFINEKTLKINW